MRIIATVSIAAVASTGCAVAPQEHHQPQRYARYEQIAPVEHVETPSERLDKVEKSMALDWRYGGEMMTAINAMMKAQMDHADPTTRPETSPAHFARLGDLEYHVDHVWTADLRELDRLHLGETFQFRGSVYTRGFLLVTLEISNHGQIPVVIPRPKLVSRNGKIYDAAPDGILAADAIDGLRGINPDELVQRTVAFSLGAPILPGIVDDMAIVVGVDGGKLVGIRLR